MSEDMSPEQKHTPNSESKETQSQIRDWTTDVKRQIEHGNASVFVHARVDFDIEETGVGQKLVKTRFEGYKNFLLRNTTGEIADEIKGIMDAAVRQGDKEAEDDLVLPREHSRKEDTLYISIVNPLHFLNKTPIARKYAETAMQYAGNKDIVEVRYKQPKADKYDRTSEKIIYMVLPMEESQALQSIIRQGVDANEVRDSLASIFVDEKYRDLFDANLVDVSKGEVVKQAEKPSLNKISLGVSQASGEARFVPGKIEIIDSIPSNKNKSAISDTAGINPDAGQAPGVQAEEINMLLDSIEESANPSDKFSFDPVDGGDGGRGGIAEPPASGGIPFDGDPIPHDEIPDVDMSAIGAREVLKGIEGKDFEGQLKAVRELLHRLESNNLLIKEGDNLNVVSVLEENYSRMQPEVAAEAKARVRLKDSAILVRLLSSPDETTVQRYRDIFSEAERTEYYRLLKNEDLNLLISAREMNGIPTGVVFDYLQDIAYNGIRLSNGNTKRYASSMTTQERQEFNRRLMSGLTSRVQEVFPGISREDAVERAGTGLRLVDKTATALAEKNIWMFDNVMKNPIAQSLYLREARHRGDHGPLITQQLIMGLGTSYLRQLQVKEPFVTKDGDRKIKTVRFFNGNKWDIAKRIDGDVFAAHAIHKLQRVVNSTEAIHAQQLIGRAVDVANSRRGVSRDKAEKTRRQFERTRWEQNFDSFKLKTEGKDFTKLGEEEYEKYLISYIPKLIKGRELLLTQNWDIKDLLNRDKVNSNYNVFTKLDPDDRMSLRRYFLTGAIDELVKGGVLTHIGAAELRQLFLTYIEPFPYADDVTGEEVVDRFVTVEEMRDILKDINAWHRGGINEVLAKFEGIVQTSGGRR